jgi:SNF2 family DNA or RNA helicase
VFEHHEMRSFLNFNNPPIVDFYPDERSEGDRKLRDYQMYGLAWMESRVEHGGGILGDEIGLGKVYILVMVTS